MKNIVDTIIGAGPRLLIKAELEPVQGSRFQPTGFPDLGPALYQTKDGQKLLVESPQSMANRLEAVGWDSAKKELIEDFAGISYVRVEKDGVYYTSSIEEAHRLNSPRVMRGLLDKKKTIFDLLHEKSQSAFPTGAVDRPGLAKMLFELDLNSLVHGIFIADGDLMGGRMRVERALSAFIEADDVKSAASGGVKNDRLDPSGDAKKGLGNVPFQREEFTAEKIYAYFNLDLAQIRGYDLPPHATRLIAAVALYKISAFLEGNLRLRTACDLKPAAKPVVTAPSAIEALPDAKTLKPIIRAAIDESKGLFHASSGCVRVAVGKE